MEFVKIPPSGVLQPYVKHLWLFSLSGEDLPYSQLFYPYGSHELIFYLENEALMNITGCDCWVAQPKSFFSGQFLRPFTLNFSKKCTCIGASLYPWAGNLLYNIPSDEFTGQMIPIHEIDKDSRLEEQFSCAENKQALFDILQEYLESKICNKIADKMSCAIAQQIIKAPSWSELNNYLTGNVSVSRRRVEQVFLKNTGLNMGAFIKKVRFQKSVSLLQNKQRNLTHTALDSGYYDQANFINEFKYFSGLTPLQFTKQRSEMKAFLASITAIG